MASKKTTSVVSKVVKTATAVSATPVTTNTNQLVRCGWVTNDQLYLDYHDHEWGRINRDHRHLFEMLSLESCQAGLSWITVLKKRENFKAAFHNFDVDKVAAMTDEDVNRLLTNTGIIRHRGKLEAIINNAKMVNKMKSKGEDLVEFFWSFSPITPANTNSKVTTNNTSKKSKSKKDETQKRSSDLNGYDTLSQVPTSTIESDRMSEELKSRGFKFVGTTICYSFMQACGLVNDHVKSCICFQPIKSIIDEEMSKSTKKNNKSESKEEEEEKETDEEDKENDENEEDDIDQKKRKTSKSQKSTSEPKKKVKSK